MAKFEGDYLLNIIFLVTFDRQNYMQSQVNKAMFPRRYKSKENSQSYPEISMCCYILEHTMVSQY